MKNLSEEEQLLINYLDQKLSKEEIQLLEETINKSKSLKIKLHELTLADAILRKNKYLEVPSKNFTFKVLQNLHNDNPKQLSVSRNGIFLLTGIVVAVGITAFLLSFGSYDLLNGNITLQSFNSNKNLIKLPTINFPGKLIINIILIATTAISFIVLDKTVLRPFFAKRAGMIR